ncbi:hypothetical protein [Streptomyces sp. cg35]|uniref:hypothetical protein n=1 Tax=Streptomyces sp. cg35 TaxID=3421650 RepID=UPI003D1788D4
MTAISMRDAEPGMWVAHTEVTEAGVLHRRAGVLARNRFGVPVERAGRTLHLWGLNRSGSPDPYVVPETADVELIDGSEFTVEQREDLTRHAVRAVRRCPIRHRWLFPEDDAAVIEDPCEMDERVLWQQAAERYTRRYLDAMLAHVGDVPLDEEERRALRLIARHEGGDVALPLARIMGKLRAMG